MSKVKGMISFDAITDRQTRKALTTVAACKPHLLHVCLLGTLHRVHTLEGVHQLLVRVHRAYPKIHRLLRARFLPISVPFPSLPLLVALPLVFSVPKECSDVVVRVIISALGEWPRMDLGGMRIRKAEFLLFLRGSVPEVGFELGAALVEGDCVPERLHNCIGGAER